MDILSYVIIGIIFLFVITLIVIKGVEIYKMPEEERKGVLVTYLKGLVALAEREIGSGNGKEKLQKVIDCFEQKAPISIKILLTLTGKDNLVDFIESALKEIKEDFGKKTNKKK